MTALQTIDCGMGIHSPVLVQIEVVTADNMKGKRRYPSSHSYVLMLPSKEPWDIISLPLAGGSGLESQLAGNIHNNTSHPLMADYLDSDCECCLQNH